MNPVAPEFVTDLDLWRQSIPVERFLSKLTQRYALRSVLEASRQKGSMWPNRPIVRTVRLSLW